MARRRRATPTSSTPADPPADPAWPPALPLLTAADLRRPDDPPARGRRPLYAWLRPAFGGSDAVWAFHDLLLAEAEAAAGRAGVSLLAFAADPAVALADQAAAWNRAVAAAGYG